VLSVRMDSAGGIRTHGLELMTLARTASPLPRVASKARTAAIWPAGVEPAISGSQNRRVSRSPTARRGPGRGPGGVREVDDRGIEPRGPAVSERCLLQPARRRREAEALEFRASRIRGCGFATCAQMGRRQGIAPCSTGSQPAGSLLALRRSLAGRTRTPIRHGRSVVLVRLSYGEETLSTGIEPASPGRQPGRMPRRVRERETRRAPSGIRLSCCTRPGFAGANPGCTRARAGRAADVRDRRPPPLDDRGRGQELRRLGSNQHSPGNSRSSYRLNDVAS
jgi:hypothetical protein